MKKSVVIASVCLVSAFSLTTYFLMDSEPSSPRSPASIPGNYESLKACDKQDIIWSEVEKTQYKSLPEYKKFGLPQILGMSIQKLSVKGNLHADFAPQGWKKYLHRRGVMAKVEIVPKSRKYTGIFEGAECALLRLSLTYRPVGERPVAPGLALKVLRDGQPSANVSALVSLDGQDKDFNFFKNPMSNIVPTGTSLGQKLVHKLFKRVSHYPEELVVEDMASLDSQGEKEQSVVSPRQLFFIPNETLKFSSEEHEVREDIMTIPEGTIVYKIYAVTEKYKDFNYGEYTPEKVTEFLKESEYVGDIVSTSRFLASDFGDDGIFFKHQIRP